MKGAQVRPVLEGVRRAAAAAALLATLSGGCTFGGDDSPTTRQPTPAMIDENVGAYGGIEMGSSEADVRRVFGEPGEGEGFFPLGETFGEIGGAPGVRNWPPDFREAPTVLRYEKVAFLVGPRGVYAFVVIAEGARTKRGVGIGDPLARARQAYGAGCGEQPYGEPLFGGEMSSFRWCRTTIDDRIRLWFGRDPIRSITLARVGAGASA